MRPGVLAQRVLLTVTLSSEEKMETMTSTANIPPPNPHMFTLPTSGVVLDDIEKSLIVQALERTGRNQSAAARLLGISRYALRYRMAKHSLR